MATFIQKPTSIEAAGQPPKSIEEFIGRVNSGTAAVSIARMKSPCGWLEPGQTPEFDEYTVVLQGCLHVKLKDTTSTWRPGRRSSSRPVNGSSTAALVPPVPSTSQCACLHSRPRRFIGRSDRQFPNGGS